MTDKNAVITDEYARAVAHYAVDKLQIKWEATLKSCRDFAAQIVDEDYDKRNLIEVCARGDIKALQVLIDSGVDIRKNNDEALFYASANGRFELMRFLVERGAPLETLEPENRQYFEDYKHKQIAFAKKNMQTGQYLGAIFNAQTWVGHAPEMLKLWQQVPEILQTELDFQHVLSTVTSQTMKRQKPKVIFKK